MGKQNSNNAAQATAVAAPNNAVRNANNNALVRLQQRVAAALALRAAKHNARVTARKQQAYMLAVQQLSAQYGMPVPNTMSVRPVNTQQKHAPSAVQGACARVQSLCVQHNGVRSAVLAACKAEGINPATAATQYGKYRKANNLGN